MGKEKFWRGRRVIGIVVLLSATVIFYHAFTVETPTVSASSIELFTFPSESVGGVKLPSIALNISAIFSAKGSISVNNPVSVHILVLGSNLTDFTNYYQGIAFTDAISVKSTNPLELQPLVFEHEPNGSYVANGKVKWEASGSTWIILIPNIHSGYILATAKQVESASPFWSISDVSDTLSVNSNQSTLFLTWVLVGFSVLMLQPILEAILLNKDKS